MCFAVGICRKYVLQRMYHRHKQASYICTSPPALPTQLPNIPRPFTSCLHNKQHLVHIKPQKKTSILVLMDSFQEHSTCIYLCICILYRCYICIQNSKKCFNFPFKKGVLPVFFRTRHRNNPRTQLPQLSTESFEKTHRKLNEHVRSW